jgi:hypothetical protein
MNARAPKVRHRADLKGFDLKAFRKSAGPFWASFYLMALDPRPDGRGY